MTSSGDGMPLLAMTTIGSSDAAQRLARTLVERRLVACVNIVGAVRSIYRWNGMIQDEEEQLLLMKTMPDRVDELREAITELHPYDLPEFVAISVDAASEPYARWIAGSTRDQDSGEE